MALPPHTESKSTPSDLEASRIVVPSGKLPLFPEGMNAILNSFFSASVFLTIEGPD